MTEITINVSGREIMQIFDGLQGQMYQLHKEADAEEYRATELQINGDYIHADEAERYARSIRDKEQAACSAYRKLKRIAKEKGLIT